MGRGYTEDLNGAAEGISLLKIAPDGSLEDRGLAIATPSPSYLTRSGDLIYGVGEGAPSVSAFRVVGDELHFHGMQDEPAFSHCRNVFDPRRWYSDEGEFTGRRLAGLPPSQLVAALVPQNWSQPSEIQEIRCRAPAVTAQVP